MGISCECGAISSTTLINDLGGVFSNAGKNLNKAFSSESLSAILSFSYVRSFFFILICIKTGLYICMMGWGYWKDKKIFKK